VRIDEFAHALSLEPSSLLRVSCSASLAMSVVSPALVELKKKLPGLTVSLADYADGRHAEGSLEQGVRGCGRRTAGYAREP
jgi:hypothetical protein